MQAFNQTSGYFAMILLFCIMVMASNVAPYVLSGDDDGSSNHKFLDGQCEIKPHDPGTYIMSCTCKTETLTLSEDDISAAAPAATVGFHISDCNQSTVVVKTNAFRHFDHLRYITFSTIDKLVLEHNSVDLYLIDAEDFSLTFEKILGAGLFFEENSVIIQRAPEGTEKTSLVICKSYISGFPKSSVNGSFTDLRLEEILLTARAQSGAIDVGGGGSDVIIDAFETLNGGLEAKWLLGNLGALQIIRSRVLLKPYAFAGIRMTGSTPTIKIRHNEFGSQQGIPEAENSQADPSLPKGAFDINTTTTEVSIWAENNQINCDCKDLIWIRENPEGFLQTRMQFNCKETSLTEAVRKCPPLDPNNSSVKVGSRLAVIITMFVALSLR